MKQVIDFSVRKSKGLDFNLPYVTSSLVEAVTTCPKWGIIHNVQHKRFVTGFRQMALEAGSLMHEVFSIYNLWHLAVNQGLLHHALHSGSVLFGADRFDSFDFTTIVSSKKSEQLQLEKLAYNVIGTSDFYDDPNDKNRTLSNIEYVAVELANYYLMNHAAFTIFVADKNDPTCEVGIEKSLDVVFTLQHEDSTSTELRFIGLCDTIYQKDKDTKVKLGEYKTTSSMNDAWSEAFKTRHQLSAYNGALEAYFENTSYETIITGSTIPVRKTVPPVMHFPIDRDRQNVIDFLTTALYATSIIDEYPNQSAVYAPMFTHSCNRYFRPCSLIDLCCSERDDQIAIWEQMEIDPDKSPSELKALLRQGD